MQGTPPWAGEVSHDRDRVLESLRRASRSVDVETLEPLGQGWDNTALLVNGRWVLRLARRELAAELLEHERRVLTALAGTLPLPVPEPAWWGVQPRRPGEPRLPFVAHERLPGRTGCSVDLTADEEVTAATHIAGFLRALHEVSPASVEAPGDELGRGDLRRRLERHRENVERARSACPAVEASLDAAERRGVELATTSSPHAGAPRLVHGDLYLRHVLFDDRNVPSGVIDWGDVHAGDPAVDLSLAYSWLGAGAARDAFFDAYGPVDAATHARARFRALHYGVILSWYGASVGDGALERVGARALRGGLDDDA